MDHPNGSTSRSPNEWVYWVNQTHFTYPRSENPIFSSSQMKTFSILLTFWIITELGFANTPSGELREALSEAGVANSPITPTFGELIVDPALTG